MTHKFCGIVCPGLLHTCCPCMQLYKDDGLSRQDIETLVSTFGNQALDFFGALRASTYDGQIRDWMQDVAGGSGVAAATSAIRCSARQSSPDADLCPTLSCTGCKTLAAVASATASGMLVTVLPPLPSRGQASVADVQCVKQGLVQAPVYQNQLADTTPLTGAKLGVADESRVREMNWHLLTQNPPFPATHTHPRVLPCRCQAGGC
jgi:hypothetical protein